MSENRRRRNNGAQNRQVKKARTNNARRILLLVGLMSLVAVISIGSTIAWLTDTTDSVTNTFTTSDVDIELAETKDDFKMIPGNKIEKDPKVTVKADSEACWLFVKIEESDNLDDFIIYAVDVAVDGSDGWTKLTGVDGVDNVYYREVSSASTDQTFNVIGNKGVDGTATFEANKVLVKEGVTKAQMAELAADDAVQPTLTFTAYACQKDNVTSAADAWAKLNPGT